eukprot:gene906-biopygen2491
MQFVRGHVDRPCSQAQRAALLLAARRDSTWQRGGAVVGGRSQSVGAALAEQRPTPWATSAHAEDAGNQGEQLAKEKAARRGEEERVRLRSRQRREREQVDPRRVVLRLAPPAVVGIKGRRSPRWPAGCALLSI